ncbi:MAG: hypothetical protein GKS05_12350 [Nitrospirales bacterium]|nr:hypothetical protein [Nitrospirales bacterium]
MTETNQTHPNWQSVQSCLMQINPSFCQEDPSGALTLQLDDEEWMLEVTPTGQLICQAGYNLDDMKSLLSDGTAEDLGSDELAKQAKFYLQQTTSKYRNQLKADGFTERVEMNDEYVAVFFERVIDLQAIDTLQQTVEHYCRLFQSKL